MDTGTVLLIIVGVILLVALLLLFGGGMAMGGMAMMAGMMATPIGWIALLIILALVGFLAYAVMYT
ncbi:MAG: hypothetical protein L3J16_01950 [Anaerolineales bacterium]|nr:hypothetical protein [Anaerolineales bacterium]